MTVQLTQQQECGWVCCKASPDHASKSSLDRGIGWQGKWVVETFYAGYGTLGAGAKIFARYADRWETQQEMPISELLNIVFVMFKNFVLVSKCAQAFFGDLRARYR